VYGFLYQDRYLMDRRDLNRSFPGSKEGSLAARLADLIMRELLGHATHIIDLHSGSLHRINLPQIRANIEFENVHEIARAFNTPVILQSRERDGSFRQAANDKEIPLLLFEAGEALRFDETAIKIGIKGIINVMRSLDMLPKTKRKEKAGESFIAKSSFWIRAHHSGIIRLHKPLGKRVEKDEIIGKVVNPLGSEEYPITSPLSGIIIGMTNLPLVHEGAAVLHVASFEELSEVEKEIEIFHASLDNED
jgi:predicted deacylase